MSVDRLEVVSVATRLFQKGEDLLSFVLEHLPPGDAACEKSGEKLQGKLKERSLLVVTSKLVSLAEGRVVARSGSSPEESAQQKETLVRSEADAYLGVIGHGCHLTIKHGHLVVGAGIDESNSPDGGYILYPEDPFASAHRLWKGLREACGLRELGVILSDSRTMPLRQGVIGTSLAHAGFEGIRSRIGDKDLFGRSLKMTQVNIADALAAAAVVSMGESDEQRPLAVITGCALTFSERMMSFHDVSIDPARDLYAPYIRGR